MKVRISSILAIAATLESSLSAAEFVVFQGRRTFSEADRGFHYYYRQGESIPMTWPEDWRTPDDYWEGTWHVRIVLDHTPLDGPFTLQPCIWMHGIPGSDSASELESCAWGRITMSVPGVYTFEARRPKDWWHKNKGANPVDFSRPRDIKRLGLVLRDDQGAFISPIPSLSPRSWEKRSDYLPFVFHLSVVSVSNGSTFSGWESYPLPDAVERGPARSLSASFDIKHTLLANLGPEHIANAVHRRTEKGVAVTAWGSERMVEWAIDDPTPREVVAPLEGTGYSNGGCALDVTGDGVDEIVVARGRGRWAHDPELCWFKPAGDGEWTAHRIDQFSGGNVAPHDIQPISFRGTNGAEIRGVVAVVGRRQLFWYQVPADPTQPWDRHLIAELPEPRQSGMAIGDIAGNGRADVACGMYWAECPPDPIGGTWKVRRFGHWTADALGAMAKLQLADMNDDGHVEIVATQAEIPGSKLGIFHVDRKKPDDLWAYREIDAGLYCPHSLVLADLDGNGRDDIIVGEMSAGGWQFPLNPRPRIIVYLNHGDGTFESRVLVEKWGVHEMGMLPRNGNGPFVLYAADETQTYKFPAMKTHLSTWSISRAP